MLGEKTRKQRIRGEKQREAKRMETVEELMKAQGEGGNEKDGAIEIKTGKRIGQREGMRRLNADDTANGFFLNIPTLNF